MTASEIKFPCPHCEQRLGCDTDLAGREVNCPGCDQRLIVPHLPSRIVPLKTERVGTPGVTAAGGLGARGLLGHILLGAILGALAGSLLSLWGNPGVFLAGEGPGHGGSGFAVEWVQAICCRTVLSSWGVFGAVVGGVWARQRFLRRLALAFPGVSRQELLRETNFSAPLGFLLATASWLLGILMWRWVLTQPAEAFHDQGGMIITFGVLPASLVLWIVGGPVALLLGQRGEDRACSVGGKPHHERMALAAIVLSRLMVWGGVLLLSITLLRL